MSTTIDSSSRPKDSGMTGLALALWLSTETEERSSALSDLLTSGDVRLVEDGDGGLGVIRSHSREITNYEIGTTPILPTAVA